MPLRLSITDASGSIKASRTHERFVTYDLHHVPFEDGDAFVLDVDPEELPARIELKLDASLPASILYLTEPVFRFPIPFGEQRDPYGKHAFSASSSWGYARLLTPEEYANYRNLALNAYDFEGSDGAFPHASANTGKVHPCLAARNAIDGVAETAHHGAWPYSSWGINGRSDAWLRIDFSRPIETREMVLFLRADFPHDAWWCQATVEASDGSEEVIFLAKTGDPQRFAFNRRAIEWVRLKHLEKADAPSPWPALSQIQIWGRDLSNPFSR